MVGGKKGNRIKPNHRIIPEPTEISDSCGTGFYRRHRTDLVGLISTYFFFNLITHVSRCYLFKSRKENPQKLTQLSSRSHPIHLVGKRTAQKDTIIDITSDSQVNSNFPYRWSPASLTFNNYFYLFLYLYIT